MAATVSIRAAPPGRTANLPAVLVVAGSDSSGGAGIEADIKTLSAHGVYGATCITALTAQNTLGVRAISETSDKTVGAILDAVLDDFARGYPAAKCPLRAIKTGMLTPAALSELQRARKEIDGLGIKLIVDPVMVSTSGARLMNGELDRVLELIRGLFLVTPNFVEALELANAAGLKSGSGTAFEVNSVSSISSGTEFAKQLQEALGCQNLLVKGGHIPNFEEQSQTRSKIYDFLVQKGEVTVFESHFIDSNDNHGSGCTLASAISGQVALGKLLFDAVTLSLDFVHRAMSNFAKLGKGNGPLNHTVKAESRTESILQDKEFPVRDILGEKSVLEYLILHPTVQNGWKRYTEHPFLKLLATNQLSFPNFLYYLKQDYYYLANYAQMHGLAAGVAPTPKQTRAQADIIISVVEEMEKHRLKLANEYGLDYDRDAGSDPELQPGPACLAYCDYLIRTGQNEDFLGIKIALAPCLHGYYDAGLHGQQLRLAHDGSLGNVSLVQAAVYELWLSDYSSEWYFEAHSRGVETLDEIMADKMISLARMDELVKTFAEVVELEIGFWDEVVERE